MIAVAAACADPEPSGPCGDDGCVGAALPAFAVENPTAFARTDWARVALPFAPGQVPDPVAIRDVVVDGQRGELVPLKWHYDPDTGERSSLAIGLLTVPVTLAAGERRELTPQVAADGLDELAFQADVAAWLTAATDGDHAWVEVELTDGQRYRASLVTAGARDLTWTRTGATRRYRDHFRSPAAASALALTSYFTLERGARHGELVLTIGNDTVEQAVGGLTVRRAVLHARAPFLAALRAPSIAGGPTPTTVGDEVTVELLRDTEIADGAAVPYRLRFAVGPLTAAEQASYAAAIAAPLIGLATPEAWRASHAPGPWGILPPARFTDAALARARLADGCSAPPAATPVAYLGYVNHSPPNTGAQPDFTSNLPLFMVQALQTSSPCPLYPAMLAVDREVLRPSFYFRTRDGVEDRIRHSDYPELFFWGGRPHFDATWNPDYPEFTARTGAFSVGDRHGWSAMDDQHYGNNALRAVYELTGDGFLRDVLVAHQSLVIWNYLTRWRDNTSAERAARLMKEAVLLYAVDDTGPSSRALRERVERKNRETYLRLVEASMATYQVPAIATVRDDARVELTTRFPGQDVSMAWQTGFHMEFQRLALIAGWDPPTARAVASAYLGAAARAFFEPGSGQPVTYVLLSDPTQRSYGGIGETWWTGWVALAEQLPDVAGAELVRGAVKARLATAFEVTDDRYWVDHDAWRSFE